MRGERSWDGREGERKEKVRGERIREKGIR
jgi:hypothetical protein